MINSICYEIRYSQNGPKLLQNFLGHVYISPFETDI